MKKVNLILGAVLTLLFISCEGPQGFDGFDGFDGEDGLDGEPGIQAQVFEVEGVNFFYNDLDNLHETTITFSDFTNFETLKEDIVLVYRYDGPVDFENGTTEDSWGLIPQNYFLAEGTIQYVPSHTLFDVQIFIDGNFNLLNLDTDFTDNQIFRIAILPGVFASDAKFDTSNINSVMNALGISEDNIQKIKLN